MRDLVLVDVAGSPRLGDVTRPWVLDFAEAIFGAYDAETGRRLIRDFFLLVSKKNGKSTDAAAIMLTALIRNWRLSAEYLILAPTIEVAQNAFNPARDMIKADPELEALLHVNANTRTITHRNTGAILKVVAASNETVSGKKAVGVLIDELWLFGKRANSANMLREATGGLAARPEGFVIYVSTQSDEPPAGVFKEKLQKFRDVRDAKVVDPRSLGVLYEFPPAMLKDETWRDPKNYYITNPNLGASVSEEFLIGEFADAERTGPHAVRDFAAKHLNVEIGVALRNDRWAGADHWEAAAESDIDLDAIVANSDVVCVGIDGGGLDDLLGLAVLGRDAEDHRVWRAWCKAWCHPTVLERRKSEADRLRDFEKERELVIVDQLGDDIDEVAELVATIDAAGVLGLVGLDPAGVGSIVDALDARGIGSNDDEDEKDRVVAVSQGYRLMGAIKTAERKLADGTLHHAPQAIMNWCVGNARTETKGNAILITKQVSGSAKIDPLMALFNAVALMSTNPEARGGPSVYDKPGFGL